MPPRPQPLLPTDSALAELEQDWQEGSGGGGRCLRPFSLLLHPKVMLWVWRVGVPPPLFPLLPTDAPGQFSAAFQDGSYLALPGHLFPRG